MMDGKNVRKSRVLFQNKINLKYCASGWFYCRNYLGDKIEERYKGKTPDMYGEEEKCIQVFSGDV